MWWVETEHFWQSVKILRQSYCWAHICLKYDLINALAQHSHSCFSGRGELVVGNNCVSFHFMSQQCFQAYLAIWIILFLCYKNKLSIHHHTGTYRSLALVLVENLFVLSISQWRAETHVCYHHHKPCLYVWYCWRMRISALAPLLHVDRYIFHDPYRYIGTTVHHTLWWPMAR